MARDHRNNFIAGYQSPKHQAEYNTLAMDSLYDRIIDFFRGDPLLHDSNDGSITARVLTAETVYHPTTYQPHGVLITLKDAKRTQYMLRIQRADLSQDTPPAPPVLEAHVEPKQLPPNTDPYWDPAGSPSPSSEDDGDMLLRTAHNFRRRESPDYWMILPIDSTGRPLYALSLSLGECPSVQNAIAHADAHLETNPDHRVIVVEGFRTHDID